MTEEPMTGPDPLDPDSPVDAGLSTDLVVPERRTVVRSVRRRPGLAVRARAQLERLRQNPAAMVAVSAAATVGSALVTAGLRRTLGQTPLPPARGTEPMAISGYVVHEVHVIHHVVHHVIAPPSD